MAKPKILFVDDDHNVLTGFRLILRNMRNDWDAYYASNAIEALALIQVHNFDVVIADMVMPEIDGAELLSIISKVSPNTVRIILSGYSDSASVMSTVLVAHQYLCKPCSDLEIKAAINKSLRLRCVVANTNIKEIVTNVSSLQVIPAHYNQLLSELQDQNSSLQKIGDIITADIGMAANILRLVNSAFFGLPTHISNVHHAVSLLGVETIRFLVVSLGLFSSSSAAHYAGFSLDSLWAHSVRASRFCKAIAKTEADDVIASDCFIAGMLHDIGKLVLANAMPADYASALERVQANSCSLYVAERDAFGTTHAEVGAYLLNLWGFKDSIVEAVCWHHDSGKCHPAQFSPLAAVVASNYFDHDLVRLQDHYWPRELYVPAMDAIWADERYRSWRGLCEQILAEQP